MLPIDRQHVIADPAAVGSPYPQPLPIKGSGARQRPFSTTFAPKSTPMGQRPLMTAGLTDCARADGGTTPADLLALCKDLPHDWLLQRAVLGIQTR